MNGGGGNDTFNVGDGLWDFGVIGILAVDGGAGSDSLLIDDMDDTGADNYALNATVATKNTAFTGPISYTTIESLELAANGDANVITVTNTFDGDVEVRGRGGADQIIVAETFPGRAVVVEDGPDLDQVQINANGVGTAAVEFTTSQDLASLTIGTGGSATLTPGGNKVINTQTVSMTGSAVLDLTDNDMIIDYTGASPINGIIAILIGAYNGGAWNGPGIHSSVAAAGTSTAIGYAEASSLFTVFPATFAGQSVDNTSVVLKYTFNGDSDLSGNVNLADFNRLAANFGQSPRQWIHGNSNFDSAVNLADFNKLAANFGSTGLGPQPDMRGPAPQLRSSLEELLRAEEDELV